MLHTAIDILGHYIIPTCRQYIKPLLKLKVFYRYNHFWFV